MDCHILGLVCYFDLHCLCVWLYCWFATMNLIVLIHAIIYGYYGLRSIYSMRNKKFGLFWPLYITILQIVEMVIGMTITAVNYLKCELTHEKNTTGVVFAGVMHAIYFYLFFQLFTAKKNHIRRNPNPNLPNAKHNS